MDMSMGGKRSRILHYASERDAELLETEVFLNYIAVVSRKVEKEHCIIRLILSTLATPEEIQSLTKKDLRQGKGGKGKFYSVRFFSKGKTRVSPIDEKTFKMIKRVAENIPSRDSIFKLSKEEIDEIIRRNSPPGIEYNAEKLRNDVIKIISDNLFFESELNFSKLEKMQLIFQDSNPLYSGVWDVDDDVMLAEFLQGYSQFLGDDDLDKVAEKIGEPIERLKRVLEEF